MSETDLYEQLHVGDSVAVRLDDGQIVVRTVRIAPWQLGHGQWVVGLHGISGGYALSRVVRVYPAEDQP